jgi:hypothetical protein
VLDGRTWTFAEAIPYRFDLILASNSRWNNSEPKPAPGLRPTSMKERSPASVGKRTSQTQSLGQCLRRHRTSFAPETARKRNATKAIQVERNRKKINKRVLCPATQRATSIARTGSARSRAGRGRPGLKPRFAV